MKYPLAFLIEAVCSAPALKMHVSVSVLCEGKSPNLLKWILYQSFKEKKTNPKSISRIFSSCVFNISNVYRYVQWVVHISCVCTEVIERSIVAK